MASRMAFIECGGNGAPLFSREPIQANLQALHGLVFVRRMDGREAFTLLEETGIDPKAKWLIAEGADATHLSRSVPLSKALDDAMIALYQNGERLMPGNGYPVRLLLPGWEGNMNIKWLRRIQLTELPGYELLRVEDLRTDPARRKGVSVLFPQEVKSFITHPSPGLAMRGPGFYEISGLAYSGNGRISKVMVSPTAAQPGRRQRCRNRSRAKPSPDSAMPWRWDGAPAILQSRAWDEAGNVQPTVRSSSLFAVKLHASGSHCISQRTLQRHHELDD